MANSTTTAPSRDFQQDYRDLLSPYDYDSTESLFADLQSNTLGSGLMNDTASGVTVTDLGIMQSPEWENVEYFKTFLRQEVVDELEFIERDFINADLFGNSDGLLTDALILTRLPSATHPLISGFNQLAQLVNKPQPGQAGK